LPVNQLEKLKGDWQERWFSIMPQ